MGAHGRGAGLTRAAPLTLAVVDGTLPTAPRTARAGRCSYAVDAVSLNRTKSSGARRLSNARLEYGSSEPVAHETTGVSGVSSFAPDIERVLQVARSGASRWTQRAYHPDVRLRHHYRRLDLGRRVAIRALVAFVITFLVLRIVTAIIHFDVFPHGPFRDLVTKSGLHIHHLFWGILLLMLTGFVALATRAPNWHLRIAIVFGIALALTLDEFALWLRLADVYWSPEGIESVKATVFVAALLALYAYGQPFWHAVVKELFTRK
jgi:hypothetical protein